MIRRARTTYVMKQACLQRHAKWGDLFTVGETAMLQEESYAVNAKGEVFDQPKFIPLDANIRFMIEMTMRGTNSSFKLDPASGGWCAFKEGLRIRHRITHPKTPAGLTISDQDLDTVRTANAWFHHTVIGALLGAVDGLRYRTAELVAERIVRMWTPKLKEKLAQGIEFQEAIRQVHAEWTPAEVWRGFEEWAERHQIPLGKRQKREEGECSSELT